MPSAAAGTGPKPLPLAGAASICAANAGSIMAALGVWTPPGPTSNSVFRMRDPGGRGGGDPDLERDRERRDDFGLRSRSLSLCRVGWIQVGESALHRLCKGGCAE